MGLSLSLLFLPLEVQAATQCAEELSCVGYDDSDVEHKHKITLQDKTFSGGTAKKNVVAKGNSTIKDGTFQEEVQTYGNTVIVNGTFQRRLDVYDNPTIENGSFSSICVYGDATITGGTFGGRVAVGLWSNGKARIQGGTFKKEVEFDSNGSGTIEGGVFEERVVLGSNNVTITGGTFLEVCRTRIIIHTHFLVLPTTPSPFNTVMAQAENRLSLATAAPR